MDSQRQEQSTRSTAPVQSTQAAAERHSSPLSTAAGGVGNAHHNGDAVASSPSSNSTIPSKASSVFVLDKRPDANLAYSVNNGNGGQVHHASTSVGHLPLASMSTATSSVDMSNAQTVSQYTHDVELRQPYSKTAFIANDAAQLGMHQTSIAANAAVNSNVDFYSPTLLGVPAGSAKRSAEAVDPRMDNSYTAKLSRVEQHFYASNGSVTGHTPDAAGHARSTDEQWHTQGSNAHPALSTVSSQEAFDRLDLLDIRSDHLQYESTAHSSAATHAQAAQRSYTSIASRAAANSGQSVTSILPVSTPGVLSAPASTKVVTLQPSDAPWVEEDLVGVHRPGGIIASFDSRCYRLMNKGVGAEHFIKPRVIVEAADAKENAKVASLGRRLYGLAMAEQQTSTVKFQFFYTADAEKAYFAFAHGRFDGVKRKCVIYAWQGIYLTSIPTRSVQGERSPAVVASMMAQLAKLVMPDTPVAMRYIQEARLLQSIEEKNKAKNAGTKDNAVSASSTSQTREATVSSARAVGAVVAGGADANGSTPSSIKSPPSAASEPAATCAAVKTETNPKVAPGSAAQAAKKQPAERIVRQLDPAPRQRDAVLSPESRSTRRSAHASAEMDRYGSSASHSSSRRSSPARRASRSRSPEGHRSGRCSRDRAAPWSESRCVLLHNVYDPELETLPDWWREIGRELRADACEGGRCVEAHVPGGADGAVVLVFERPDEAAECVRGMHGRWFGGRRVSARGVSSAAVRELYPACESVQKHVHAHAHDR